MVSPYRGFRNISPYFSVSRNCIYSEQIIPFLSHSVPPQAQDETHTSEPNSTNNSTPSNNPVLSSNITRYPNASSKVCSSEPEGGGILESTSVPAFAPGCEPSPVVLQCVYSKVDRSSSLLQLSHSGIMRLGIVQSIGLSTAFESPSAVNPTSDIESALDIMFAATSSNDTELSSCSSKIDMLILPEMWNTPYSTKFFQRYAQVLQNQDEVSAETQCSNKTGFVGTSTHNEVSSFLRNLAIRHSIWVIGGSVSELEPSSGCLFNTCLVYDPVGALVAKHRKMHLFDISVTPSSTLRDSPKSFNAESSTMVFRESDTLAPGNSITTFKSPWGEVGIGICYDMRFAEMAMSMRYDRNVKLLVYPGAFNPVTGPAHWQALLRARAIDTQSFVVGCALGRAYQWRNPSISHSDKDELTDTHVQLEHRNPSSHVSDTCDDKAYSSIACRVYSNDPSEVSQHETVECIGPINYRESDYRAYGHSTVVDPWGRVQAECADGMGIMICELDMRELEEVRKKIPISIQRRTDVYGSNHSR
eukprot:GHVQ01032775.1.p1 GENE.GHVQ01032775.1~~GHVQ01032775.1.p1  ORF type:complete len:531 (+),score=59.91 GHVQ01032775.1:459-2051(+)